MNGVHEIVNIWLNDKQLKYVIRLDSGGKRVKRWSKTGNVVAFITGESTASIPDVSEEVNVAVHINVPPWELVMNSFLCGYLCVKNVIVHVFVYVEMVSVNT